MSLLQPRYFTPKKKMQQTNYFWVLFEEYDNFFTVFNIQSYRLCTMYESYVKKTSVSHFQVLYFSPFQHV